MTATVTFIGHQITQTLNTSGEEELKQQVQLVQAMIASTFDAVERESSRLLDIYAARYPGTFTLDESKDAAPVLRHNKTCSGPGQVFDITEQVGASSKIRLLLVAQPTRAQTGPIGVIQTLEVHG